MSVSPFVESQTFESLRVSDFDCYSAYGEAIDNSIQANARNVRIFFSPSKTDSNYIGQVVFIDDGKGMDEVLLQHCLRLGYSSRYGDRSGIGRFGVGMTLGAIHECRRVDVYSKQKDGQWHFTYLDLDEVTEFSERGVSWTIPAPIKKDPHDEVTLSTKAKDKIPEHGTIVIWNSYDNRAEKLKKAQENSFTWFGRTFRYYMIEDDQNPRKDDSDAPIPVTLWIDNKKVPVIDPLWLRLENSDFPDDDRATEETPIEIEWPINNPELEKALGRKTSKVKIRFTLYPESLRDRQGAGGSQESIKRSITENEGFSFVRHGREVGYSWIPRFAFAAKEIDRFWGCEILFEPELDSAFTVKNIKRGAVPIGELKATIEAKIKNTIKRARDDITNHWKKSEVTAGKSTDGKSQNRPSEEIVKNTPTPPGKLNKGKPLSDLIDKGSGGDPALAALLVEKFKGQPFSIIEKMWPPPAFMEIQHAGGKDLLAYNLNHEFFEVVKVIRAEIDDGDNLQLNSQRLSTLIDILLIAYAKAESMFDEGDKMTPDILIEQIKSGWGLYLLNYLRTWRKEFDKIEESENE